MITHLIHGVIAMLPTTARIHIVASMMLAASATGTAAQSARLAQTRMSAADAIATWVALVAPPAWESTAAPSLTAALRGWQRDDAGNWIMEKGSGSPHRVVACSIDQPSYVVSEIRPDGWLRVQLAGRGAGHPLWTQQHEGHKALVITRGGQLDAVFATPSTHLIRRGTMTTVTTADDLYVDVGAENAAEVEAMGIRMLDPVVRDWPVWPFQGMVAGPAAGERTGCAAIASLAAATPADGRVTFVIATLGSFGSQGLGAALTRLGHIDQLAIAGSGADTASMRQSRVPAYVPASAGLQVVTTITPAVRWPGTFTETIDASSADSLRRALAAASGITTSTAWLAVRPPVRVKRNTELDNVAALLATLANTYGVSEHEGPVREAVLAHLPAWARERAVVDDAGNVVVSYGPDRDTVVFLAHMDETGYEVRSIAGDGTVTLTARGGMQPSLWEGQPAMLHFDDANRAALRGVFIPRMRPDRKQPRTLTAWFGLDSAALARAGVQPGMSVTMPKRAARIGRTRFAARSLDDRAGSTAQLLAIAQIDPSQATHKTIFVWTVEEETGLVGASAVADRFGTSVDVAYSIDTFVSSDSPLESTRFAFAALGAGPVLRALDSYSSASPAEVDRILGIADAANIPLHANVTSGGADGSTMVRYGARHSGVSWPGRYSHSPVEVLDLRDLQQLADLIVALAT
jgi:putative aminopeptidase FrvX